MIHDTPTRQDTRRYMSARAAQDAGPNKKRVAFANGVTVRTVRRWYTPSEAQGSPLESFTRYLATAEDAFRVVAHLRATVVQNTLTRLSAREIVDRIHQLLPTDAVDESADNVAKVSRGLSLAERAVIAERDAATDLELAALYAEAASRGLSEADVFGQRGAR